MNVAFVPDLPTLFRFNQLWIALIQLFPSLVLIFAQYSFIRFLWISFLSSVHFLPFSVLAFLKISDVLRVSSWDYKIPGVPTCLLLTFFYSESGAFGFLPWEKCEKGSVRSVSPSSLLLRDHRKQSSFPNVNVTGLFRMLQDFSECR